MGLRARDAADLGQDLVRAAQGAGDVVAHADRVQADGHQLEHRVEGDHAVHLDRLEREVLGDVFHELGRDPAAELLLAAVQSRDERRPLLRVVTAELVELRHEGPGQSHQRSTSPITKSRLPMMATMSDRRRPLAKIGMAWTFIKLGARMWQRSGRELPSERR